jgi:uncharacterized integral membrane protein
MGEPSKQAGLTPTGSAAPSGPTSGKGRNITPKQATTAVAVVVVVVFALLNFQNVTMHWVVGTTHTPLIILVAGCLLIGLGIGYVLGRRTHTPHDEASRKN